MYEEADGKEERKNTFVRVLFIVTKGEFKGIYASETSHVFVLEICQCHLILLCKMGAFWNFTFAFDDVNLF